ncbi:MAG: hypothetical protein HRT81_13030 [Henriciella sp.]|nr:hypothetical protein [Henriciella sp.]
MEAYWRSLASRTGLHPGDLDQLDNLILALLHDPQLYPWPHRLAHQCIPEDAVRTRLVTAGILQVGTDTFSMEHDRVLNWAAARALLKTEQGGQASIALAAERFAALRPFNAATGTVSWRLGYLLMDLFAVALNSRSQTDALELLHTLSEDPSHHEIDASFYSYLLPTLGVDALPFY